MYVGSVKRKASEKPLLSPTAKRVKVLNQEKIQSEVSKVIDEFKESNLYFQEGQIKNHLGVWKTITSDKWVLDIMLGAKIELEDISDLPIHVNSKQSRKNMSDIEKSFFRIEIARLRDRGIINECTFVASFRFLAFLPFKLSFSVTFLSDFQLLRNCQLFSVSVNIFTLVSQIIFSAFTLLVFLIWCFLPPS